MNCPYFFNLVENRKKYNSFSTAFFYKSDIYIYR